MVKPPDSRLVFDYQDPESYTAGYFAFRATWSRLRIGDSEARPTS
ncbi:DUF6250 domain-containing protein [Streptomyces sp. NPDC001770]